MNGGGVSVATYFQRLPKMKLALLAGAVAIAVVATVGPSGDDPAEPPSAERAMSYVTGRRIDLGAPGVAIGVVDKSGMHASAAGNVTVDTPIPIGSVTKSFTALAVMQLAEAHRLDLATSVVHYLPRFTTANSAISSRITVRELLSHTSGLPTSAGIEPLSDPETTLREQVADLSRVVAQTPGVFRYSNANYEVLGELVETVSGETYADYVHQHILEPLDMTRTYTDLTAAQDAGLRTGHRIWFGAGVATGIFYRADFLPAGFLVSNVNDLNHYMSAMLNGGRYRDRSILSPAGIAALTTSVTPATLFGAEGGYGFGWYQRPTGGLELQIDPGIAQNIHADIVLDLKQHVGVALLSNAESDLYLATIPKFDLAAINAVSIAAIGKTQTGLVEGLYVIFDLLVLGALLWYLRTLMLLIQRRINWYPTAWYGWFFPLWREVVVPVAILIELPYVYGQSWSYLVTGDVGCSAAIVASLGLLTLVVRVWIGIATRRRVQSWARG